MFTTIMYGFINEVTRQQGSAALPLQGGRKGEQLRSVARTVRKARSKMAGGPERAQLPARYRVLADSFKRAAGFQ